MFVSMVIIAPTVKLNNGKCMPVLGLGTFMLHKCGNSVIKDAVDIGYRSFDTAYLYQSEKPIGEALREKMAEGVVKREDLFITSKVWCTYAHPDMVVKACKATLNNLGLDYIDLYLIHWPFAFKAMDEPGDPIKSKFNSGWDIMDIQEYFPKDQSGNLILAEDDYVDTWKQMEKCVELGLTKSIGVSNFNSHQLERLLQSATIKPVVNQVECHPYLNQLKLKKFCEEKGILITAYGPLGSPFPQNLPPGVVDIKQNPTVLKLAQKYNKTPAQIILKYLVQLGTIPIPKTENPKRLLENISIFDFNLSPEEITEMNSLDCNSRIYRIPGTEGHKYYPFNAEF